mgnify:CR=1 FL=1
MYSKAMILQLWYRFLDLDSSRCCWLLAAAGCRQQWLRPRSSPNGACGEWRTRAVRAPPGSRVPQTHAAPEKRFSCYTHKPRGGRQGGSFLKPEARSPFNQALSMMVMAGDGGARPAFIQVRKGTIHAAFHLARFDMHDLTTDPCMCSDSVHVT